MTTDKELMIMAGLDQTNVLNSLVQIERAIDKMVKHSDSRMKRMGAGMEVAVSQWRGILESFHTDFAERMAPGGPGIQSVKPEVLKSYDDLSTTIKNMVPGLEAVANQMRDLQPLKVADLETGETTFKTRAGLRDEITTELAKMRGDELQTRLQEIMMQAKGIVKNAAVGMSKDLEMAFKDPTASGKVLLSTVMELETSFKNLGSAALSAQLIPTGTGGEVSRAGAEDIVSGIYAQEKGQEMLARIDSLMNSANERVVASATLIRNNLTELLKLDPSQTGGAEYEKELNKIIAAYNKISGLEPIDKIQDQEKADALKLEAAYRVAGETFKRVMLEGDEFARDSAISINNLIEREKYRASTTRAGYDKSAAAIAGYAAQLKGLEKFKIADPTKQIGAEIDANILRDKLFKLMQSGEEVVADAAARYRMQLTNMLKGDVDTSQLVAKLNEIEKEMQDVIDRAYATQELSVSVPGVGGIGGQRQDLAEQLDLSQAERWKDDLEQRADAAMNAAETEVREGALNIKAQLQNLLTIPDADKQFSILKDIEQQMRAIESIKPLEYARSEQKAAVENYYIALEKVKVSLKELEALGGEAAKAAVRENLSNIQSSEARVKRNEALAKQEMASITAAKQAIAGKISLLKAEQKERDEVAKTMAAQKTATDALAAAEQATSKASALKSYNQVLKQAEALLKSTSAEARTVGAALQDAAIKGKNNLQAADAVTEELNAELQRTQQLANRAGDAFNTKVGSGVTNARAKVWKFGTAMDRVGARSVGTMVRLVDAFEGFSKAALAGVLAVAGVAIAIQKLAQVVVELGKKAAQAFAQFIKGSVEVSKSIEVTDRLLGSLLKRPDLGVGFRNFLLDESFRVGLDLTDDFARAVVPLSKSTEQIREAATQAGILAHAFQQTEESVARAFKQATGGHFRPLQQLFGITPQEIDQIQKYQEEFGNLEGVIMGLEEALEFRGLSLDAIEGTLQFLTGQFNVLRKVMENTAGEPVKDALAKQLKELFILVEDKGHLFKEVFAAVGDGVADVITKVGELARALIGDIGNEDVEGLQESISTLSDSVNDLIDDVHELLTTEDSNLFNMISSLVDKTTELAEQLSLIADVLDQAKGITEWGFDLPFIDTPPATDGGAQGGLSGFMRNLWQSNLRGLEGASFYKNITEDIWNGISSSLEAGSLDPLREVFESAGEDGGDSLMRGFINTFPGQAGDALRIMQEFNDELNEIDRRAHLGDYYKIDWLSIIEGAQQGVDVLAEINASLPHQQEEVRKTTYTWEEYLEALEKLNKAEQKYNLDRRQREADIRIKFDRLAIKDAEEASDKRKELYSELGNDLYELSIKLNSDQEKADRDHERKDEAAYVKYQDKLTDIDLKNANKKVDIETKYREKLAEIRRKFDLDAEEAIRRNDAVSLLRIRRKMRAELKEADIQRKNDYEKADDARERERAAAKVNYERALRDNQTHLDDKHEDLLIADKEKREEMHRQLMWEKHKLRDEYKKQREERKKERKLAFEDLDKDFSDRREQMDLQYQDEYNIVDYWKAKETGLLSDALDEQDTILQATYQAWYGHMTNMRTLIDAIFGGGLFMGSGPGPWAGGFVTGLEGYDPLNPPIFRGGVSNRLFIPPYIPEEDDDEEGQTWFPGRQHGGFVTEGNRYGVNERGVEAFMATQAGMVLPREAMMLAPPSNIRGGSIDNSRHMNADVSLLDPTQLSPMMIAMARSILTDEILRIGF